MTLADLTVARANALLGDRPRMTLVDGNDPDTCLSIRLGRVGRAWIGVVDDGAALLDRVRMGLQPRFIVHPDADTSTISGELEVRVLGRADADPRVTAVEQPFGLGRAVVIEVVPRSVALEPIESGGVGAIPRT